MARIQYKTKESSINYSSMRTDGENKGMKASRGLPGEKFQCRIYTQAKETVMHWFSGSTRQVATEYLKRHNNALTILCVALDARRTVGKKYKMVQRKGGTIH